MAKELVYRVRIDYDASEAAKGGQTIDRSQEQAEQSVNKTTAALRRQQEAQERTTKSARGYDKVQSNANQTLFSFGDLLNDSQQFQFGFAQGTRAIGNNIGFAAEQFSQISQRTGGFKSAIKALGSSLLGPGGAILAINAAVTAITVFGDKLFDTEKKAESFNEELKSMSDFFGDIASKKISDFLEESENAEKKIAAIDKALQNLLLQDAGLQQLPKPMMQLNTAASDATNTMQDRLAPSVNTINKALDTGAGQQAKISQEVRKVLINKRAELKAQQAINRALRDTFETTSQQVRLTSAQLDSLSNFIRQITELNTLNLGFAGLDESGIFGSPEQLEKQEERKKQIRIQKEKEAFSRIGKTREQAMKDFESYYVADRKNKEQSEQAKTRLEKLEAQQRKEAAITAIQATGNAISTLFGKSKAVTIATAIIDAGAAIVRQYKDLPLWAAIPSSAAIAARTAQTISQMKEVEPGSGSVIGVGGGGAQNNTLTEGIESTSVDRTMATGSIQQANRGSAPININLQTEADSKIIRKKSVQGKKELESTVTATLNSE